jgi:hypothetical protein
MNIKTTKRFGVALLLVAVVLGAMLLPSLYPARSGSGADASLHRTIQQLALAHLSAGVVMGFGVALLVWPFHRTDK